MYLDDNAIVGLISVGLTCIFLAYFIKYMIKHIKEDEDKTNKG